MTVLGLVMMATTLSGIVSAGGFSLAESGSAVWKIALGMNSASLGRNGALIVSSSVVSWPDGRQDLITFWEAEERLYRCIDRIASSSHLEDGPCFTPR